MGSADEVNIQASELNRTMKVRLMQAYNGGLSASKIAHFCKMYA
jgi:hypothetical protein